MLFDENMLYESTPVRDHQLGRIQSMIGEHMAPLAHEVDCHLASTL